MTTVITCSQLSNDVAVHLLPATAHIVTAGDRVYRLYESRGLVEYEYRGLDGELLIRAETFPNWRQAQKWIKREIESRTS